MRSVKEAGQEKVGGLYLGLFEGAEVGEAEEGSFGGF